MKFMDGLHRTIDWYFGSRERETVERLSRRDAHRALEPRP